MVQARPPMGLEGTSPPPGDSIGGDVRGGTTPRARFDDDAAFAGAGRTTRAAPGAASRGAAALSSASRGGAVPATNTRKRSEDARRFAASAAAQQGSLTRALRAAAADTARGGGGLGADLPSSASARRQHGYLDVYPRGSARKPPLLAQLESLLHEKLRLTSKLTESRDAVRSDRDAQLLDLDAHRAVFEAFVHAFGTYRPLLSEIKARYDAALENALKSERENASLRAELRASEERRVAEVEIARADAAANAANLRGDDAIRAAKAEARAEAAETAALEAKARAEAAEARAVAAEERMAAMEAERAEMRRAAEAEASWAGREESKRVLELELGPVPKHFPRADATLAEGEGGVALEPREDEGEEEEEGDGAVGEAEGAEEGKKEGGEGGEAGGDP